MPVHVLVGELVCLREKMMATTIPMTSGSVVPRSSLYLASIRLCSTSSSPARMEERLRDRTTSAKILASATRTLSHCRNTGVGAYRNRRLVRFVIFSHTCLLYTSPSPRNS